MFCAHVCCATLKVIVLYRIGPYNICNNGLDVANILCYSADNADINFGKRRLCKTILAFGTRFVNLLFTLHAFTMLRVLIRAEALMSTL